MTEKVLFVDDDARILTAFERRLNEFFTIATAGSGPEGVAKLQSEGPFAVVVADMRMPQMNGIEFLAEARRVSPYTVRMMLTGYADMETAMKAVNEGYIFRFLTKPIAGEALVHAVRAGIRQYRLEIIEHEMLAQTLSGVVELLTDLLGLVKPVAFGKARRIQYVVEQLLEVLKPPRTTYFEVAAMLSQIGTVTVPDDVLERADHSEHLTEVERLMLAQHPESARKLLAKIPRFDLIAQMIGQQYNPPEVHYPPHSLNTDAAIVAFGSQLLNLALAFDYFAQQGLNTGQIVENLDDHRERYNPHIFKAVELVRLQDDLTGNTRLLSVLDLEVGMVVLHDVWSHNEILLVERDQAITDSVLIRLQNFAKIGDVSEPIRVQA